MGMGGYLKIGIIGTGKVGCALAIGLKNIGFEISGLYSRSIDPVKLLNSTIKTELENDLLLTVNNSEVIFLTVPDDVLKSVAKEISNAIEDLKGKTFFHCSGALTSDVLDPLKQNGGETASLHPIQTFADKENGWIGLVHICFGFEGCEVSLRTAQVIVNALSSKILIINKENKMLYHAAASILSNYMVTLSYIAGDLLVKAGIDRNIGFEAFLPLIGKTVKNIELLGSVDALTGPISRGDLKTINEHVKSIKEKAPEVLDVYKVLGNKTVGIALKMGSISEEAADELKRLLSS